MLNEVHKKNNDNNKVSARSEEVSRLPYQVRHKVLVSSFHLREFYPQTQ